MAGAADRARRLQPARGLLGDFSDAFNSMVALLQEREESLKAEIAGRALAEEELQRERDLLVRGPVITIRWDIDDEGTVQYVSPNVTSLGYSAEEFVAGRARTAASSTRTTPWLVEDGNAGRAAASTVDAGVPSGRQPGELRWVRDFTHAVRDDGGAVVCYEGYVIDITPQKTAEAALRRREEQLRMLSLTDDLTGLYNRRGLLALGEHMMRTARRHKTGLGVLFLDLDGLKEINDRYGHRRGDDALRETGALLRRASASRTCWRAQGATSSSSWRRTTAPRRPIWNNASTGAWRPPTSAASGRSRSASTGVVSWQHTEKATLHELIERADARMYEDKRVRKQG